MKQKEEAMECKEELRQMIENIEDTDTIKYTAYIHKKLF